MRIDKFPHGTKMKTKIGVIGVGHLGSLHAKMYSQIANCEFIGVFDLDIAKRNLIASQYNVKSFSSCEEMFSDVDAVSIASITSEHFKIAKSALLANINVLIEKPITTTIDEADELIKIAKENKIIIQVGHIERFNPAVMALEKYNINPLFIESHRMAQFNPRGTDVAVVHDLMIHDIDLILSIVKSPVKKIDANGIAVVSNSIDIANARLQFENGCVANVTASRISQNKMRKMRFFQTNAYISIDFQQNLTEIFRLVDENESTKSTMMLGQIEEGKVKRNIIFEQPEIKEHNALLVEIQSFVNCVEKKSKPIVSGEDGLEALKVAQQILEVIKS